MKTLIDMLISFATAKLAKEKGFNLIVKNYYYPEAYGETNPIVDDQDIIEDLNSHSSNAYYIAPTQSLLQRWLREVHGFNIVIVPSFDCFNIQRICQYSKEEQQNDNIELDGLDFKDFGSYEEALEEALQTILLLIE